MTKSDAKKQCLKMLENPAVPVFVAATLLGVSRQRIYDLFLSHRLERVEMAGGFAGVGVCSIAAQLQRLNPAR